MSNWDQVHAPSSQVRSDTSPVNMALYFPAVPKDGKFRIWGDFWDGYGTLPSRGEGGNFDY